MKRYEALNPVQKMTCKELADAIEVATANIQRYSKLQQTSSKITEAAEKHFIALLEAQRERAK